MTKLLYHKNHEDPALVEVDIVDLVALPPRPNEFLTKKDFVDWSSNPATDHCYYSFWEPKDPTSRATKDNGPGFLHGFCADYDVQNLEQSAVERAIKDCVAAFPVAYVSRTFSRGIRMLWLFEKPLPVFNEDVAKGIAKRAIKELKLKKLAPGFDEEAFLDPAKYYELGTEWKPCSPDRTIPSTYLNTWALDASNKADFTKTGKSIPLEAIEAEMNKRWPGRWQGPFAEGSMGVRFWDPTATNQKGAWIRETGVQAFTGECKFLHWDVIFGKEFVAKYESDRIGGAVDNTWYDGAGYWQKNSHGKWMRDASEVYRRYLSVAGLNSEKIRGAPSEIDRAMASVEDKDRRLDGAFPFLYSDKDTHVLRGSRYLNVSSIRPVTAADGVHYWGESFPWLASWLEQILGAEQIPVFLAWFAHAYQGAIHHKPRQGHALFIVGPTSAGKTLLASKVVGEALGGFSEATNYIMGTDQFNGDLFGSGVWTVDDAVISASRQRHEGYSQFVKKVVANPSMTYRKMYQDGVTLPWLGRLIVTLNMNAIEMLPNIEAELLDKVIFFRVNATRTSFVGCEPKITAELPHLLAYLRDLVASEDLKDPVSDRFGIKSYHHPDLLAAAADNAPSAGFAEIVNQWRTHYFTLEQKKTEWSGSALEFLQELNADGALHEIVRQNIRGTNVIGRFFNQLMDHKTSWLKMSKERRGRIYTISKP